MVKQAARLALIGVLCNDRDLLERHLERVTLTPISSFGCASSSSPRKRTTP
jgi:hypothetical protein